MVNTLMLGLSLPVIFEFHLFRKVYCVEDVIKLINIIICLRLKYHDFSVS